MVCAPGKVEDVRVRRDANARLALQPGVQPRTMLGRRGPGLSLRCHELEVYRKTFQTFRSICCFIELTAKLLNVCYDYRMILIGQTHTMFNLHTDNVDSATWQTQIKGRKRWRVCPPSETPCESTLPCFTVLLRYHVCLRRLSVCARTAYYLAHARVVQVFI